MPHPLPETPRLRFRELHDGDAPFLLELLNDPGFIANIADRGVRSEGDARAYLAAGPAASYAKHGYGLWAVEMKPGGELAGMCGLVRRDFLEHADLGYAFLPGWRGRGLATEAARATLAHAFGPLALPRLLAIVNEGNLASRRLLESLGMQSQGLQPVGGQALMVYAIDNPAGGA